MGLQRLIQDDHNLNLSEDVGGAEEIDKPNPYIKIHNPYIKIHNEANPYIKIHKYTMMNPYMNN